MTERLHIIKVGGNIIESDHEVKVFLHNFSSIEGKRILIHGGGKIATEMANQLGYKTTMIEGRRVTDSNMLKVVTMIYGGSVNKNLVSQLQSLNVNAVGLTGADGNLITSKKRPMRDNIDFGWVGDPVSVNTSFVRSLLENNLVPVVAPLTHDKEGNMLNTNADTMANTLAIYLSEYYEVHLSYVFELPGVLVNPQDPETLIRNITAESYSELKNRGTISGGMIPKLDNAFHALSRGVKSVKISNIETLKHLNNQEYDTYTTIS